MSSLKIQETKPLFGVRRPRTEFTGFGSDLFASSQHFAKRSLLPKQLQGKLDLARRRRSAGDDAGRGAIVITLEYHRVGFRKVRVIENVEGLRPELQVPLLIDADLLEQRCVDGGQSRPG